MRIEVRVKIMNRLGLHARPAMAFVDTSKRYKASVRVAREGLDVDGKSIMEMMMLAATKDTVLIVTCEGDDAQDCCDAIRKLVDSKFGEE